MKKSCEPNYTVSILAVVCVFFTLFYLYGMTIHPASLRSFVGYTIRGPASNWQMENSLFVNETVEFCSAFQEEDAIECVVTQVGKKYNYVLRDATLMEDLFRQPEKFKEEGYICRDAALAYDAIFRRLGFFTDFVYSDNHVYNTVYNSYVDCQVNMDVFHCW